MSNSSLIYLNLSGNHIENEGLIKLGECLKFNSSLIYIDLSSNHIGNEGIIQLKKCLKSNSSLIYLDLHNNETDKYVKLMSCE